ncbi:MAG TPA: TolC family protein [Polyangiaceae bacterium]|nr:TolC family protein [Polyangiaceae bacterium]
MLDRVTFVHAVLKRNPSVEASRQAWRAALAERAQASALDDPMLEYSFAPLSIGSGNVPYGQVVTLSQQLPWPGKKALAGEVALAEAETAAEDFAATRLRLALMASLLFDQYYAVERSLELNQQHNALVRDIKAAALAQYETGRASQQEPLQAEVELAHVEHERIVMTSRRAIIVAQMNGLLHRAPQTRLPPPPTTLDLPLVFPGPSTALQKEALSNRPELKSQRARVRGRQAARDLADRESYPDFGVMASYNSMWAMPEHQWMLGFSVNVPLQLGRRRGAVEQADARIAQATAELLGVSDEIRVDVEKARQRLIEAGHVVRLYRNRLLPAARAQIEAARSGYVTGQTTFQALIDSERSLRNVELNYQQSLATLGARRAELVRALGRIPRLASGGSAP